MTLCQSHACGDAATMLLSLSHEPGARMAHCDACAIELDRKGYVLKAARVDFTERPPPHPTFISVSAGGDDILIQDGAEPKACEHWYERRPDGSCLICESFEAGREAERQAKTSILPPPPEEAVSGVYESLDPREPLPVARVPRAPTSTRELVRAGIGWMAKKIMNGSNR